MAKGNNVVEFTLRAKDHVSRVLSSIGGGITSFAKGLLQQGANIQAWGQMFGSVFGKIQQGAQALWSTIKEAFKFETLTTQFETLLGSLDAAKERMAMLAEFAEKTPYSMEGVVKAARTLTVMSKDSLGTQWALRLVGDAAAATGGSIEELSTWIGRAYAMIQAGKPFGEAAMRLTELGALTPEVRQKMEDLQAAGASNVEVWRALTDHLETFGGAMEKLSQTGDGLTSTLEDNWTAALRTFGEEFVVTAKESVQFLIDKLAKLQSDGTIQKWAKAALDALKPVRDLIMAVFGDEETRGEGLKAAWDYLKNVFNYGATLVRNTFDYAGKVLHAAAMDIMAAMKGRLFGDRQAGDLMRDAASEAYRIANMHATELLKEQTRSFASTVDSAATKARERAAAEAPKASASTESTAEAKAKAEAGLREAEAARKSAEAKEKKAEEDKKAAEEAKKKRDEALRAALNGDIKREQAEREAIKAEYEALLERKKAAEAELDAAKAKAQDSQTEKDERIKARREAKRKAKEDERLQNRAKRMLAKFATLGDKEALLSASFDTSKLTHSERALRDFILKQRNVEDLTNKANNELTAHQIAMRASLERIEQMQRELLTLK